MTRISALLLGVSLTAFAPLSSAQDDDVDAELREETRCVPAKDIREFLGRFDGLEASKRDAIDVFFEPKFIINCWFPKK